MGTKHSKGQVLCFHSGRSRRWGGGGFGGQACTLFLGLTKGRKNIFSRLPPLSWGLGEQAPHFTLRFESDSVVVEISRLVHITQNSNAERLNDMKMSEYGVSVLIILLLMQTIPSVKLQVFIMCTFWFQMCLLGWKHPRICYPFTGVNGKMYLLK